MLNKFKFITIFFLIYFKVEIAYSYIDPGTGSFILQSILAVIAAIAATVGAAYINFKNLIRKIFKKKKKEE